MSTNEVALIRGMDQRVQQGIEQAQQRQTLAAGIVKSVSYAGANVQLGGSAKILRNVPVIEGMELVEDERVLMARVGRLGWVIVGASAAIAPARDATPYEYEGPYIAALEDNAGLVVEPDPSDQRIQFTDDGIINADRSGNSMALSIAESQIDHANLGNVLANQHHNQAHGIVGGDHTVTGSALDVVGLTATDTLGLLTPSSDPGAASALLKSDGSGGLTLQALAVEGNATMRHVLPEATDTYDLGSSTKLWRKGYLSEMEALLFVENSISLIGGWLMLPHDSGTLAEDVNNSQTTIDFGKAMTQNDFVLMRAILQVEYIQVGTLVSGTTYNVTRNLDGSGANSWVQGTPFAVLGYSGDGRIELNAQTQGPMIQLLEQGSTYNAQTERIRIGDLNGWGGYGTQLFGLAVGDWSGNKYLTYDATNGLRVRGTIYADNGQLTTLSVVGTLTLSGSGKLITAASPSPRIELNTTYLAGYSDATTKQFYIQASDGKAYAGGGVVRLDANGIEIVSTTIYADDHAYRFTDGSNNHAYLQSRKSTGDNKVYSLLKSKGITGATGAELLLWAVNSTGTLQAYLDLKASGITELHADSWFNVTSTVPYTSFKMEVYGSVRYRDKLQSYKDPTTYDVYAFHPLTVPLTSTSWDGDAKTTGDNGTIDLSAVFGVPAGVKAVLVRMMCEDETVGVVCRLGPSSSYQSCVVAVTQVANQYVHENGIVPCDGSGDVYWSCSDELDYVLIQIWGYWI